MEMSITALKARLAKLGIVRAFEPPPVFPGEMVMVILRRDGIFNHRILVAKRLFQAGLSMVVAHKVITQLANTNIGICEIAEGADISFLARDLALLDVQVFRQVDPHDGVQDV